MSLVEIFELFDKNKDGMLSMSEFSNVLLNYSPNFFEEDIEQRFREADVDGDGQIDFNEFILWFERMLKRLFDICDVDCDGKITAKELSSVMATIGKTYSEEESAEKLQEYDTDNDGCLDFEDCRALVFNNL